MSTSMPPREQRKKRSQHGFTIIEVLIAMAVFSIGILGVAAMQTASVKGNATAQGITNIAVYATDRLEKLMVLPYNSNQISNGVHSIGTGNITMATDGIDNDFDGFIDESGESGPLTISWTVTDNEPILNTKTVVVTVEHASPSVRKTVDISRIIPRIL